MEQSTIEKISQVALMQGVTTVNIHPVSNQIWFSVDGHDQTWNLVDVIETIFGVEIIDNSKYIDSNNLSFRIYPDNGLIITIDGRTA